MGFDKERLPLNQVILGDCVEILKGFPENSVDLVVTDPPYGLSFMGKEWDKVLPPKAAFDQVFRVLKPGALAFVMSSPRQDLMWRMCALLERVGFDLQQSFISWVYKTGFPKAYDVSSNILKRRPEDEAKRWDGWKSITGLKPALEPVLMVNKPFSEKTIVDNVLRWGTGAINVDACRIPVNPEQDDMLRSVKREVRDSPTWKYGSGFRNETNYLTGVPSEGRFPANLLVSDGAFDTGEITHSGKIEPHHTITPFNNKVYGEYDALPAEKQSTYGDSGDQSRYFDLDAWAKHHGILDVPKPGIAERDYGLKGSKGQPKSKFNKSDGKTERFDGAKTQSRRNTHPTVKPTKLMAYLIELGCPKNGVVLDPFVGTGTTCIAAKLLQRKYVGIEIDEEYHRIAEARVAAYPVPLEWLLGGVYHE